MEVTLDDWEKRQSHHRLLWEAHGGSQSVGHKGRGYKGQCRLLQQLGRKQALYRPPLEAPRGGRLAQTFSLEPEALPILM